MQCSVTATSYLGRVFFRDTLDSLAVPLIVHTPPAYTVIR